MSHQNGSSVATPTRAPAASPKVTVMIYTLDEELNLPGCLDSLAWCDDVIVIDSFSRDRTEAICKERGVRFYQHAFEGFGSQRNWSFDHCAPRHEWILVLDADERVPNEMAEELGRLLVSPPSAVGAYRLRRRLYLWGRWLEHSSLYPTWVVRLVHRERVRYINRGHAETQEVRGEVGELETDLIDANEKGIYEWFERQIRYARKDAEHELSEETGAFSALGLLSADPLARRAALKRLSRILPGRALAYFAYAYLFRGGFRDGADGLTFCTMRAVYQQMVNIHKYDIKRRGRA
jgi:glycosyltransferase involved in cell wall biosynthesis